MEFQTLYKKTSTNATQSWTVSTADNIITTRWGQVDGKIQETSETIKEGKNLGKKNATTAIQQAEFQAKSLWEKKLKSGYVKSIEDAKAGKVDKIIKGGVSPMLAQKFSERGQKIIYPAAAQPKLDGHRCIAILKNGKCTLWSRKRQAITGLPHINKEIEDNFTGDVILDGECYNHAYKHNFEVLSSFIRSKTPKPGCEVVQYHVYDTINNLPYNERLQLIKTFPFVNKYLKRVKTRLVNDEDELMLAFEEFLLDGYEGAMARNLASVYEVGKRSNDLQKIKKFDDTEVLITGVKEGHGKLAGHAIFLCETYKKVPFEAKMRGEISKLKEYFDHPETVIGEKLTIKHQGWTKDNKPRFVVAWRLREDI
jgi:ATP-dependent DNA ligase